MLAYTANRQFVAVFQRLFNIVGIECGKRTYKLNVLVAECLDIGVSFKHYPKVAEELAHMDIALAIGNDMVCVANLFYLWYWEELFQSLANTYRT